MSIEKATGERGHFRFNPSTGKLEPFDENLNKPKHVSAYVVTDEIPPTETMVDDSGKRFTSRKKLEDYTHEYNKRHGTAYIHTTEQPKYIPINREERFRAIRDDIERAKNAIKYGMAPMTEWEKEQCLREERAFQEYVKRMNAGG